MRVTLLGAEHDVVLPRRYAEQRELLQLAYTNRLRGAGAVLAACVPGLEVRAKLRGYGGDVAEYGLAAWEELHDRGIDDATMVLAAQGVVEAMQDRCFPSAEEVKERAGFSAPPPVKPTGSP